MSNGSEPGQERVKEAVRNRYGELARRFDQGTACSGCCPTPSADAEADGRECCGPPEPSVDDQSDTGCCGHGVNVASCCDTAVRFYEPEALNGLPASVTGASLGCGNPLAIDDLQHGEVVLDLGSGGGIDCFLAARQVGPEGRVIGLDMTPDMVKLARRNARKMGLTNVDFRYGEMEEIPLPDESVDVIISNCVINLSPDKDAVFREAYRVLRQGGRMSVSDIVTHGKLPSAIRQRLDAWASCIAGALEEQDYLDKLRAAGFEEVAVVSRAVASADQVSVEDVDLLLAGPDGSHGEGVDARSPLDDADMPLGEAVRMLASVVVQARKL